MLTVTIVLYALQGLVIFYSIYALIFVFGKLRRESECLPEGYQPKTRFCFVIPCHNEDSVLGYLLDNLAQLRYPKALYSIRVIIDNCTDTTIEVAATRGVPFLVREDVTRIGKGYALRWALENDESILKNHDAVIILDADNLVALDFGRWLDDEFQRGAQAVQGYVGTKNPYDSWLTQMNALSFMAFNYLEQAGRQCWGLSCKLAGTGMAFSTGLLWRVRMDATSLAEDKEFEIKLVLRGVRIRFEPQARVYDEKPLGFVQNSDQRRRWVQGKLVLLSRYLFPLLWQGIRAKNLNAIDEAIFISAPPRVLLSTCAVAFLLISIWFDGNLILPWFVWSAILAAQLLYYLAALIYEKPRGRMYATLAFVPFFALMWLRSVIQSFLPKKRWQNWSHTPHTRPMTVEEIQS